MLLLRRLLIVLQSLNSEGIYPTPGKFVLYLIGVEREHFPRSARWVKLNYLHEIRKRPNEFYRRIKTILNDNTGGDASKHFIDYHEDYYGHEKRKGLAVTARGRELIRLAGFAQIIGEKYSVIWYVLFSVAMLVIGLYLGPFFR